MRSHKVLAMRNGIFKLAEQVNPESDELVLAMAEVLGFTAARLDEIGGFPSNIDDRMDSFTKHVKSVYMRARAQSVLVTKQ